MDPSPITLPQPETPKKKGFFKALFFFEIGLFEVGFVVLLLGSIFLVLNYFNVIHLPQFLPQLSILPNATYQQTLQKGHITKQNEELFSYVFYSLQPAYQQKLASMQFTYKSLNNNDKKAYLRGSVNLEDNQIIANQYFSDTNRTTSYFTLQFSHLEQTPIIVTASLATEVVKKYFTFPSKTAWDCHELPNPPGKILVCESFQENAEGASGYAIESLPSNKNILAVFACFIPKSSAVYGTFHTNHSCL